MSIRCMNFLVMMRLYRLKFWLPDKKVITRSARDGGFSPFNWIRVSQNSKFLNPPSSILPGGDRKWTQALRMGTTKYARRKGLCSLSSQTEICICFFNRLLSLVFSHDNIVSGCRKEKKRSLSSASSVFRYLSNFHDSAQETLRFNSEKKHSFLLSTSIYRHWAKLTMRCVPVWIQ